MKTLKRIFPITILLVLFSFATNAQEWAMLQLKPTGSEVNVPNSAKIIDSNEGIHVQDSTFMLGIYPTSSVSITQESVATVVSGAAKEMGLDVYQMEYYPFITDNVHGGFFFSPIGDNSAFLVGFVDCNNSKTMAFIFTLAYPEASREIAQKVLDSIRYNPYLTIAE